MGKVIMSGIVPQLVAPVTGLKLSDITVGSIVKLNENGAPVQFYVAKHDYESGLNGTGRTLLVRKEAYGQCNWFSEILQNSFSSSNICDWLNNDYKSLLDPVVQSAISETTFYYTDGGYLPGNTTVTTLACSVFILSYTELGGEASPNQYNAEGSALPIASSLQVAYCNGSAVAQWTRTPKITNTSDVCCFSNKGVDSDRDSFAAAAYARPCFTLPATALFDEETLILKGVA